MLKPDGIAVSISGPSTPAFARELELPWYVRLITRLLSSGIRGKVKKLGVHFELLFMRADGRELAEIARLVEAGTIRPVTDKVYGFDQLNEALAYVESGRAKGKVVVKMK